MRRLWREAADAMKQAERVFIIGYSFPEEDSMSMYLLDHYLDKKFTDPSELPGGLVYIFDQKSKDIIKRIRRKTTESPGVHFEECCGDFRNTILDLEKIIRETYIVEEADPKEFGLHQ